ncbi:ArsR/SmtB family transcription factor [Ktedonosporobacter rubrisoli]|uniref:ArsR/SmtB family transcription factor n=1 Tax=Ktedonosporobacter rubrisoli TaxID=2509675 RepID=UPI0013EEAEC3|nr:metalloregulator ArsR/SmtB family transcription factor [Ktedonosporobacter rubrisoli]
MLDIPKMTRLLTALGEPARLEIIDQLAKQEQMNVGDLASKFSLSRPTISHHLKILKEAGVVQAEKSGQETYYRVNRDMLILGLQDIADTLKRCWTHTEP